MSGERCELCGKFVRDRCPDGACRACHVSVSWEDCVTGTYNVRQLLALGHDRAELRELYPNADWRNLP